MSRRRQPPRPLSPRQQRFVTEYLLDLNGKQAAIRAGYSPPSAEMQASRLLSKAKVRAAVDAAKARREVRVEVRQDEVLREVLRLAYSDVGALYDEAGALRPLHTLPVEVRRALASVEVTSDKQGHHLTRVKTWDKARSLELLMRHLGLLTDRLEVSGSLSHLSDEELRTQIEAALAIRWPERYRRGLTHG